MDVTNDPGYETVSADELARLRRIEAAARRLLDTWPSSRSASPLLAAMAELRAALKADSEPRPDPPVAGS